MAHPLTVSPFGRPQPPTGSPRGGRPPDIPCAKTRNVMFRYLEGGPEPDDAAFAHISSCDLCDDLIFEPDQTVLLKEHEPEHVGEVD